jgi:proline dehydrogenase
VHTLESSHDPYSPVIWNYACQILTKHPDVRALESLVGLVRKSMPEGLNTDRAADPTLLDDALAALEALARCTNSNVADLIGTKLTKMAHDERHMAKRQARSQEDNLGSLGDILQRKLDASNKWTDFIKVRGRKIAAKYGSVGMESSFD